MNAVYLYFCAVYDSHPGRPDLVGGAVSELVEVCGDVGSVRRGGGQLQSGTGEGAVSAHLVQCVSVGGLVAAVTRLVLRRHSLTLHPQHTAEQRYAYALLTSELEPAFYYCCCCCCCHCHCY